MDRWGNILSITDPISGNRSYTYDDLGQMKTETIAGTTYRYEYDKVGNLTSYNGKTLTYEHTSWQDLLSTFDGHGSVHDVIGNPTSYHNGDARWLFTWDGRELTQAVKNGTSYPSSYSYDENGLRITKTVVSSAGTTTHTYLYAADGTLIREIRNNADGTTDTMEFLYDHAGQPYSFVLNNVMYFYVVNLQGDVVRMVDTSGRTVASYVYNAWGKQISATPNTSLANAANVTNKNPLRYRGYYYDTETTLYYLQSRYYNPEIGRFINADAFASTGQGLLGNNTFAYCLNNPLNHSDESGEFPWLLIGVLVVSTVIGGILGASSDQKLGENIIEENTNVPQIPQKPDLAEHHDIVTQKDPVTFPKKTDSTEPEKKGQPLSAQDRVKNTLIGASLGLAVGGAIIATVGAGAVVAGMGTSYITVLGATGQQVFAIGAVAYDSVAIIVAPFFGMEMDTIEYEP